MFLQELNLTSFKNHPDESYPFHQGINCIMGKNGAGKTNLLDAINYLAFARTALNGSDPQSIRNNERSFVVRGTFSDSVIACGYEFRKGKTLKVNGEEQPKISDHVGFIPIVFTTPDDSDLIREGSEFRRKFFDGAISQLNKDYLENLISYQRALKQRNEHLKNAVNGVVDHRLLDSYDHILLPLAKLLAEKRSEFLSTFQTHFTASYEALHDQNEAPKIEYKTDCLASDFVDKFKSGRERDIVMQRSLLGAHRDVYDFYLNDHLIRKFGSQGQQKTFIISLRLAEFDLLKTELGKTPLLLLDDIFDKLDDTRIEKLVEVLKNEDRFEQIFITDARKERSTRFFKKVKATFTEL